MKKEYFAIDLKADLSEEILTAVCEEENNNYMDIITGINISNIEGYYRIKTRKLSKRSVNFWLKKLTSDDIMKYKDNIINAKYKANRARREKTNINSHSYR